MATQTEIYAYDPNTAPRCLLLDFFGDQPVEIDRDWCIETWQGGFFMDGLSDNCRYYLANDVMRIESYKIIERQSPGCEDLCRSQFDAIVSPNKDEASHCRICVADAPAPR
jgi:hypothetical protein